MDLGQIEPHWWWLIAAILLAIGETFAPGVFLIWIAIAAGITGVTAALLPIGIAEQFALFAVAAIVSGYAGRSWYLANPVGTEDDKLNDRVARLIDREVVVTEAIVHGRGRVKVGDGEWPARGPDAAVGNRVRITGSDGACLIVEHPTSSGMDPSPDLLR